MHRWRVKIESTAIGRPETAMHLVHAEQRRRRTPVDRKPQLFSYHTQTSNKQANPSSCADIFPRHSCPVPGPRRAARRRTCVREVSSDSSVRACTVRATTLGVGGAQGRRRWWRWQKRTGRWCTPNRQVHIRRALKGPWVQATLHADQLLEPEGHVRFCSDIDWTPTTATKNVEYVFV